MAVKSSVMPLMEECYIRVKFASLSTTTTLGALLLLCRFGLREEEPFL